jgi:hypothetical protein
MTPAQSTTLGTDINADATFNNTALYPHTSDGAIAIAAIYNADAAGPYTVWRSSISTDVVFDGVTWANFTPVDAPDATVIWTNRSLACQGKQFNLQTMLSGRLTIACGRSTIRAGLQDALTNLPSGVSGATLSAGWVAVRDSFKRNASRFEKLFATGTGTFAAPADMVLEGPVSYQDVQQARG